MKLSGGNSYKHIQSFLYIFIITYLALIYVPWCEGIRSFEKLKLQKVVSCHVRWEEQTVLLTREPSLQSPCPDILNHLLKVFSKQNLKYFVFGRRKIEKMHYSLQLSFLSLAVIFLILEL